MSELLKGLALGLVSFLAVNAVASALVPGLAGPWLEPSGRSRPRRRARVLFAAAPPPFRASLLAFFALFVPAYLAHEPRQERASGRRFPCSPSQRSPDSFSSRRRCAASGVERNASARAGLGPGRCPGLDAPGRPAYRITHPFPVVAVLGVSAPPPLRRQPGPLGAPRRGARRRARPRAGPPRRTRQPPARAPRVRAPTSSPGRPSVGGSIALGCPPRRRRLTSARARGSPARRSSWPGRSSEVGPTGAGFPAPRSFRPWRCTTATTSRTASGGWPTRRSPRADPTAPGAVAGRPPALRGAALLPRRWRASCTPSPSSSCRSR